MSAHCAVQINSAVARMEWDDAPIGIAAPLPLHYAIALPHLLRREERLCDRRSRLVQTGARHLRILGRD